MLTLKTLVFCGIAAFSPFVLADQKPVTIGILVPIALPAMTQIVNGFEETMTRESKTPVHFLVKNAEGDANIQRSILQTFNESDINLVAPIGTDATQMTIAMIRNKPIVAIAADDVKQNAAKANNFNVTGVNSHTPPAERLRFLHAAMPGLKKITIVYSTSSRIFDQVQQMISAAKTAHMSVQKLMVSQLSDLYSISKNIAPDSQAIFILKDELIVSGLNTLLQQSQLKNIPVIASDDGSVATGAAFALGVSEKQTGVDAAKIALQILNGKEARNIPIYMMKNYHVFLNPAACKAQQVNVNDVKNAAKKLGYSIDIL